VSGFIVAGYGLAAFIFNFVAKAVVNPNNMKPDVKVEEDGLIIKYYSEEVSNNVPMMFQILAACWLVMGYAGIYIIKVPKEMMNKKHAEKKIETHEMHESHEQHEDGKPNGNGQPNSYHSVKEILSPNEPQTGEMLVTETNRKSNKDSPPSNCEVNLANKNNILKKKLSECSNRLMTNPDDHPLSNHDTHIDFHDDHHDHEHDHNTTKIRRYIK